MKRSSPLTRKRARKDGLSFKHQQYYLVHCSWTLRLETDPEEQSPCREYRHAHDFLLIKGPHRLFVRKAWYFDDAFHDGNGTRLEGRIEWAYRVPLPGRYGAAKQIKASAPEGMDARSYASGWEKERAGFLELRQRGGEISDLKHQPVFHLTRAHIQYTADASYIEKGRLVVEDTKGKETERFKLICQLWPEYGPAPLRIVKKSRGRWIEHTVFPRATAQGCAPE